MFVSVAPIGSGGGDLVGPPLTGNGADVFGTGQAGGILWATAVFAQSQEWSFECNDGRCWVLTS